MAEIDWRVEEEEEAVFKIRI